MGRENEDEGRGEEGQKRCLLRSAAAAGFSEVAGGTYCNLRLTAHKLPSKPSSAHKKGTLGKFPPHSHQKEESLPPTTPHPLAVSDSSGGFHV